MKRFLNSALIVLLLALFCGCSVPTIPETDITPGASKVVITHPASSAPDLASIETLEPVESTPTPIVKPTPEPIPTAIPLPLEGIIIGIDPGHQEHGNSEKEPVAPGSKEMKKKVSSGTQGRWTRIPEYEVNLKVGILLRDLLEEQGATVIMTRESNNVDISNVERAKLFNEKETDYALRLHCNGSEDKSVHGAFMLVPTENPYLEECDRAAELLIEEYCKATGAKNLGITKRSDQTGFNWSERMIINLEMGHMTNEEEDYKLTDPDYQKKMAKGLFNGILEYFKSKGDE